MPIPTWYKEQRGRPKHINAGVIIGLAYSALVLVTLMVLISRGKS